MKPDNVPLKDWLIKKVSNGLIVPERVVSAVITHQFDTAYTALDDNNSVEIYEFGKFIFNIEKAKKQMAKWNVQKEMYERTTNDGSASEEKKRIAKLKMKTAIDNIEGLKPKLNNEIT